MTRIAYKDQLLDLRWQKLRLKRLERAEWKCEQCGVGEADKATLHVHHKRYVKGRMAWEYELKELAVFCAGCHADHHELEELLGLVLAATTSLMGYSSVLALVSGYFDAAGDLPPELVARLHERLNPGMRDVGVAAYIVALSGRRESAQALAPLVAGGETVGLDKNPVVVDLMQRWGAVKGA